MTPQPIIRCAIAEAIGTFCLVFAGAGAVAVDAAHGGITHAGVAIVFGLIVMAMIYAFGDTSGAHINPAVTVAFAAAGRFPWRRVPIYAAAQCLGAAAAGAGVRFLLAPGEKAVVGATSPAGAATQSLLLEAILTFILMLVILAVASGSREKGLMAGIAIGGVVALEAMFAGPVSGASMNPARSLGPALVSGAESVAMKNLWIYFVGPVVGAVAAVPVAAVLWPRPVADQPPLGVDDSPAPPVPPVPPTLPG